MNQSRRKCPVCWRVVYPTMGANVQHHRDSLNRDVCPMSGERYELAGMTERRAA